MTYYKVKKEADQIKKSASDILIKNELFTKRELTKIPEHLRKHLEPVDVYRKDIYWFFGARFCKQFPFRG